MMNVQAAYGVCKDAAFVRHTTDEYSKWEQGAVVTLKDYMSSALTKFKTLKMKGLWESPSPEQEQIIALSAAVSSLKAKAAKPPSRKEKSEKKVEGKTTGPRKNEGAFAWKDVAPKSGDPKTKDFKGKTYHWCTNHAHSQWTLHNPHSFPNLCKLHPNYSTMESAWKEKGGGAGGTESQVSAADIKLNSALAEIDESESESDDY